MEPGRGGALALPHGECGLGPQAGEASIQTRQDASARRGGLFDAAEARGCVGQRDGARGLVGVLGRQLLAQAPFIGVAADGTVGSGKDLAHDEALGRLLPRRSGRLDGRRGPVETAEHARQAHQQGRVGACIGLPLEAQSARELQVQGVGTFATTQFLGGGIGFALRSQGRARAGLSVSAGDLSRKPEGATREHRFGGRGELLLSYHANPYKRSGMAPYAGGGVAIAATSDEMFEYVLIAIGVETAPGGRSGWFAELGIGGGVRVSVGFRRRWR